MLGTGKSKVPVLNAIETHNSTPMSNKSKCTYSGTTECKFNSLLSTPHLPQNQPHFKPPLKLVHNLTANARHASQGLPNKLKTQ